ncbi:MAG: hypothetical protein Q4D05_09465 [Acinetobacter sp.]|nr:hypothetical protein [Acinetobacter sp.]
MESDCCQYSFTQSLTGNAHISTYSMMFAGVQHSVLARQSKTMLHTQGVVR